MPAGVVEDEQGVIETVAQGARSEVSELWFQDEMRRGQKGTLTRGVDGHGQRAITSSDLRFG